MAHLDLSCPTVTTSGLLTLEDHETIDSLVHNISEDTHTLINRDSLQKVTSVETDTTVGSLSVRDVEITRNSQGQVTQTVEKQYDPSGALIQTLTTVINRDSSGKVVSIDTTEVGP